MNSHKERLKTISGKGSTLSKQNNRNSNTYQSNRSTSHLTDNAAKIHQVKSENTYSGEDSDSRDRQSPLYINVRKEQRQDDNSESPTLSEDNVKRNTKSLDRLPNQSQSRNITMKSNGTTPYVTRNSAHLYKSRSLNAIKAKEPSDVLKKSSIQQEYHDKAVQKYFRGITYGKARRPCRIATAMFVLFVLFFITGLVIIGLTYLYQNIMPSLDIGEAVGPCLLAGSFVFLGVGIKFIYDAHKLSRKERRRIGYKGYNRNYVGVKSNNHNPLKANEKLVSGSATNNALSRLPNRVQTLQFSDRNQVRSSQSKMNTRTEKSSDI